MPAAVAGAFSLPPRVPAGADAGPDIATGDGERDATEATLDRGLAKLWGARGTGGRALWSCVRRAGGGGAADDDDSRPARGGTNGVWLIWGGS